MTRTLKHPISMHVAAHLFAMFCQHLPVIPDAGGGGGGAAPCTTSPLSTLVVVISLSTLLVTTTVLLLLQDLVHAVLTVYSVVLLTMA